jgi:hypothetical protein
VLWRARQFDRLGWRSNRQPLFSGQSDHQPLFPTLLQDMLHRFGYTGTPVYRGRRYHEFEHGHCEVHADVATHPSDLSMMAWFTMTTGDDIDDTLERATHQALTEFCEHHLPGLDGTTVALFPI